MSGYCKHGNGGNGCIPCAIDEATQKIIRAIEETNKPEKPKCFIKRGIDYLKCRYKGRIRRTRYYGMGDVQANPKN